MTRTELRTRVERCHQSLLDICLELREMAAARDPADFSIEFGALAACALGLNMVAQNLASDPTHTLIDELVEQGLLEVVRVEDHEAGS